MATRITQKHLLKGTLVLEVVEMELRIRKKSPFKPAEHSSVPLSVLDPEPLLSPAMLCFVSRASGQALVSLTIGKPDVATFNAFVNALKARIVAATSAASPSVADSQTAALNGNVQDAPPELADDDEPITFRIRREVKRDELEQAIGMLRSYLDDARLEPFIEALEALKSDPRDEARLAEVARLFSGLGIGQGAVLTYAPYLGFLLSDHPFAD